MRSIVDLINQNADWLYTKIYENPFFFFDYWSIAHIWSGAVLFAILKLIKVKQKWLALFIILLSYEILELITLYFALNVFRPETLKDQVTDIIVGMVGGIALDRYFQFYNSNKDRFTSWLMKPSSQLAFFTASTIAFLWVGFYGYEYNMEVLNSPGLNYTAFLIWLIIIYVLIHIYIKLGKKFKPVHSAQILWIIYFPSLCIIEFTSYHIIGWKEVGQHSHNPLIFDIIHGTIALHIYYVIIPFLAITLNLVFEKFFKAVFNNYRN